MVLSNTCCCKITFIKIILFILQERLSNNHLCHTSAGYHRIELSAHFLPAKTYNMNRILKLIFVNLVLTLASNCVFSQDPIEITYDPATRNLKLSDNGTTDVNWVNRRWVWWHTTDPYITKFEIVGKSTNRWSIFDSRHQTPGVLWGEHVRNFAHLGDWKYSIIWYHGTEQQPVYDPKIAVKPVGSYAATAVLILGVGIILLPALISFRQRRKAERKLEDLNRKYNDLLKSRNNI